MSADLEVPHDGDEPSVDRFGGRADHTEPHLAPGLRRGPWGFLRGVEEGIVGLHSRARMSWRLEPLVGGNKEPSDASSPSHQLLDG